MSCLVFTFASIKYGVERYEARKFASCSEEDLKDIVKNSEAENTFFGHTYFLNK